MTPYLFPSPGLTGVSGPYPLSRNALPRHRDEPVKEVVGAATVEERLLHDPQAPVGLHRQVLAVLAVSEPVGTLEPEDAPCSQSRVTLGSHGQGGSPIPTSPPLRTWVILDQQTGPLSLVRHERPARLRAPDELRLQMLKTFQRLPDLLDPSSPSWLHPRVDLGRFGAGTWVGVRCGR